VPGAPTIGTATFGDQEAFITFFPSTDDGGAQITSYTMVSTPGNRVQHIDDQCECWADIADGGPMHVVGLDNGTSYTFKVYASNRFGNGAQSAASNAIVPSSIPAFSVNDVSVTEGNLGTKLATFTVSRAGPVGAASSVKVKSADGTATAASGDYTALALTTLSFAAGQTSKTVSVTIRGDSAVEPDETVALTLSQPVNGTLADASGLATIVNDDTNAPPAFVVYDRGMTEGDTGTKTMVFTIERTGSTAAAVSVKYKTENGTAVAPSDYTAVAPGTPLSFPVGVTFKTVTITTKPDLVAEANEYFFLTLYSPVGATITRASGYGTLINDDSPDAPSFVINDVAIDEGDSSAKNMTFTVTRNGSLIGATSVKYATANGTAVAPGDYTARALTTLSFAAGVRTQTVVVSVRGDTAYEATETFSVVLSGAVGASIADSTGIGYIVNDD
jgi:hypothetical protein